MNFTSKSSAVGWLNQLIIQLNSKKGNQTNYVNEDRWRFLYRTGEVYQQLVIIDYLSIQPLRIAGYKKLCRKYF